MADYSEIIRAALEMRETSYCNYSSFAVGAGLLTKDGEIYKGCNIENGAFSPTICAERVAIFKAVSEGVRDFDAIAIAGGVAGEAPSDYCPPCGVCRQVMTEFCDGDFKVILVKSESEYKIFTLSEIMPLAFNL